MFCARRDPYIGYAASLQLIQRFEGIGHGGRQDHAINLSLVDQCADLIDQMGRGRVAGLGKQAHALLDTAGPDPGLDLVDIVRTVIVVDQRDLMATATGQGAGRSAGLEAQFGDGLFNPRPDLFGDIALLIEDAGDGLDGDLRQGGNIFNGRPHDRLFAPIEALKP